MDEDFPRGTSYRRSTRSAKPEEKYFIQLGVKRGLEDVLFKESDQETPSSKGTKKKKTKKTDGGETEEQNLEEEFEGATETDGFIPKPLTAKTVSEGMLVLAVIQEIHEYEIVLSLPNGLTAFVQITDVSSFFTQQLQELNDSSSTDDQDLPNMQDLYQIGNLVPCKIKSLSSSKDGHRRIQASLDYKEINSELSISLIKPGMTLHGVVSSVEDHGYTIDLGIKGTNAFLAMEDASRGKKGKTMKTGKLVTCLVKAVKANGRSILLTFDPERLKSCKASKTTHTTFSSLIPGTKLDAMVSKIMPNSLIMDIFGLYKGCVDPIHLRDNADELTKYEIGQKLVAVIIYNCPTTKSIGLSLNPVHHKTTFDPNTDVIRDLSPGDIIEDALVVRVQEKENLIVQLNPKTRGIVYHSHGSDDQQKRHSPASVGEKVRCRILSFNLFDRLAIVSLRKSILDKPFLGINDVKPGMVVKGVIESVMPRGVAVKIQDRIHGFVPRTHLADIPVQKPQERFTIGAEIELRVLLVEPAKRRVLLTHKKTMVKSSLPILASYDQPKEGMWIHGCVVAVKDFGCIVSFYNDVKGIIPRAELGMDESSSPTDNFYVGQVLKCRILRTHSPESKKLALSLKKDGKEQESFEAGKLSHASLQSLCSSPFMNQSSTPVSQQNSNEGNIKAPKPPCQNLPTTSSARSGVLENGISSTPNNAPLIRSNLVSLDGQLSRCPSETVHSIPMVTIPAEEYKQLVEIVNELGREFKEYAREIKELKRWKGRLDQTSSASKELASPTSAYSQDIVKELAREIRELKDWKQHVDQTLSSVKKMAVPGSDRDAKELIELKEREIEGYKREIKELKDWKQLVVQAVCGTEKAPLVSDIDSQGMDTEEGIQVQECEALEQSVHELHHGGKQVPPLNSSVANEEIGKKIERSSTKNMQVITPKTNEQEMAKKPASEIQGHKASKQSGDTSLTCGHAKTVALVTSSNTGHEIHEGYVNEVEVERASEQSVVPSTSCTKNKAQPKSNLDNPEMVKDHGSEIEYHGALKQFAEQTLCGVEKTALLASSIGDPEMDKELTSDVIETHNELKDLGVSELSVDQLRRSTRKISVPVSGMHYVTVQALRVNEDLKKKMLSYVPHYKIIARKLTNALFADAERVNRTVHGSGLKMDQERIAAIREVVFDLCPAGEAEKIEMWRKCVKSINETNKQLSQRLVEKCKSGTDTVKGLLGITQHAGDKVPCARASEQLIKQSSSSAQQKSKVDNKDIVKELGHEVEDNRMSDQLAEQTDCGTEKTSLQMPVMDDPEMAKELQRNDRECEGVIKEQRVSEDQSPSSTKETTPTSSKDSQEMDMGCASEAEEYERHFKELLAFKEAVEQKEKMAALSSSPENQKFVHHVTLPTGEQALCVSEGLKRKMRPFVPDYITIAKELTSVLFTNGERVKKDVLGCYGEGMDPERIAAIYEAVFDLCPAGEEVKEEMWKRCVGAINSHNRNIRGRIAITSRCESDTDAMNRLQEVTLPSGDKVLRVTSDFKKSLLPLVPRYKDVARRLVTGLFMDSERIGFEVRGQRGRKMNPRKMAAVYEAVFELCPVKEEEKKNIWKICVNVINAQNRNMKRILKRQQKSM